MAEEFECDFSTTTPLYKTMSTAMIMNSFKEFFDYGRMMIACGINNIYMAGEREDWAKMIPKLKNLEKYDVDGKLKEYINHVLVILENFLQTFDGKPDLDWWNLVMKSPESRH